MDWQTKEFENKMEKDQKSLNTFVKRLLEDRYDLRREEIIYIAEELSFDFSNRIIQVIRKGTP